ncbi:uncharacterized protein RHOBADRAFT_51856 [Rhodotorula graminis WP1]|uniref:C-CAP/cofactor C-like domain-containing protein n=1 Tax=Rhodotorula graminis (strain WP1) TaxID=578459 RepID=A0A194SBU1_RHOGW|nr:uncharacterized protein RHOBADRAFT_51856 [Rhodotorula graminis WP1]KPV76871.1 hypothetical protein RHOBADRAFT_51856 [Rhodotorula graminis WP1]
MEESPLVFVERWSAQLRALQESQDVASSAATLQDLSKELTTRAADLPPYELRRCERDLKVVQDAIATSKAAAAPKSKFSFKRAAPAPGAPTSSTSRPAVARPLARPAPMPRPTTSPVPSTALTLASRTDAHLTSASLSRTDPSSPASPSSGGALALTALTRCLVDLRDVDPFSALYLTDLRECVVLLPDGGGARGGRGGGSALVQGCEGCVVALAVHQFRMHDSTRCAVLLEAGSNPVIERCKGLRFGPYPHEQQQPPSSTAHDTPVPRPIPPLQVQDFDDPFATPDRPSPNWRALSPAEHDAFSDALVRREERGTAWHEARDRAVRLCET